MQTRLSYAKYEKVRVDSIKRANIEIDKVFTLEQYDAMFEQQDGNCAICGLPEINRRRSVARDMSKVEDYVNEHK